MCASSSAKTKLISAYLFAEYEILQRLRFLFVESEMKNDSAERKTSLECPEWPPERKSMAVEHVASHLPSRLFNTHGDKYTMPNCAHSPPQIGSCLA